MSDSICRGNCISYSGYACCGGSTQWSIIVTHEVISYSLFTYVGTGRSSTPSLKYNYYRHYEHSYFVFEISNISDIIEYVSNVQYNASNLPRQRAMKQNEKGMVPQAEDTDCDLERYTGCRAVDTMVVSVDTRL